MIKNLKVLPHSSSLLVPLLFFSYKFKIIIKNISLSLKQASVNWLYWILMTPDDRQCDTYFTNNVESKNEGSYVTCPSSCSQYGWTEIGIQECEFFVPLFLLIISWWSQLRDYAGHLSFFTMGSSVRSSRSECSLPTHLSTLPFHFHFCLRSQVSQSYAMLKSIIAPHLAVILAPSPVFLSSLYWQMYRLAGTSNDRAFLSQNPSIV